MKDEQQQKKGQHWQNLLYIVLLLAGIVIALLSFLKEHSPDTDLVSDFVGIFGVDLSLEFLSIVFTIVVIDGLNQRREKREREARERLNRLNRLVGLLLSEPPERTNEVIKQLRVGHYLDDGSLRDSYLRGIELSRCDLHNADLEGSNFSDAKMDGIILDRANLSHAKLMNANLQNARLRGTDLSGANLSGANLFEADLSGAITEGTKMDPNTILPDGQKWTVNTQLATLTGVNGSQA